MLVNIVFKNRGQPANLSVRHSPTVTHRLTCVCPKVSNQDLRFASPRAMAEYWYDEDGFVALECGFGGSGVGVTCCAPTYTS